MVVEEEVRGRGAQGRGGENTLKEPLLSKRVSPGKGGFRPGKQPQGAGAGECGEGDSLALGLRPGSFDSSQN